MWVWTLNWNEIRSDLLIGSFPKTAADLATIKVETGATALLSVQTDVCLDHFGLKYADQRAHGESIGLRMARAPMLDFNPSDQRLNLPYAVQALNRQLADGHRVYVHCTAGIGRSALTLLAYLTFIEGLGTEEALSLLKRRRPCVAPNLEAYDGCHQDLVIKHQKEIEVNAWSLFQGRQATQRKGPSDSDWSQAEHEVIGSALGG